MRTIGPHSRPSRLAIVDGRTAEAKLMAVLRRELVQHVGGNPSSVQRALIERAVALHLRLHLMDRETIRSPGMTEKNGREYLAWSNAFSRTIKQLGIKGAAAEVPSLRDMAAGQHAA